MKIMKKVRVIKMCLSCDNKEAYVILGRLFYKCAKENRKIKYPTKIPSWCPLEDYKQ